MSLDFCSSVQVVGSEFDVDKMKAWSPLTSNPLWHMAARPCAGVAGDFFLLKENFSFPLSPKSLLSLGGFLWIIVGLC